MPQEMRRLPASLSRTGCPETIIQPPGKLFILPNIKTLRKKILNKEPLIKIITSLTMQTSLKTTARFILHTREGATTGSGVEPGYLFVSIHAPVRVRRCRATNSLSRCFVSIHAPVRVRLIGDASHSVEQGFNPRTREGATFVHPPSDPPASVSIHAPVRVRLVPADFKMDGSKFQSTHP